MLQDTKINIQLHSYTNNNKLSERRIKKTVLFTTASKRILKNKLHQGDEKSVHWKTKSLLKEIEEDTNEWKDILNS